MGEIGEYFNDVKAHRQQEKLNNQPQRPCYDWILVSGSCHYAKDRSSFKEYRPVTGTAQGTPVIGIGTVELQVKRSPEKRDTHTLLLENVLHTPRALANGFNSRLLGGMDSWGGPVTQGLDSTEKPSWYGVEFCGLRKVVLAGNPQGESILEQKARETGCHFSLSIYLSEEEEANLFPLTSEI